MSIEFTATARRLGIYSAVATAVLLVAYASTLVLGLAMLESPDQPIRDPMFSILEILIIAMMPAMVALMVAVHAWAPRPSKSLSLISVVFMGLLAGLTCSLHFVILTLSRQPIFAAQPWLPLFMSFNWPSVVYALDILGWDVFFAFSMLFAAPVFNGTRLATWVRVTMFASGALALAGLIGVVLGNMQVRNIGIVGYVGVFLVVCVLLATLFCRTLPGVSDANESVGWGRREA
ncbi:MAG: hypothetical protein KJ970_00410 [Candidatus Eisenbacteria bacterium]|uniref:Uncharacterized protein n=1 Tax=Eiseniibacteriota bacterium TaxID=2212470 RepID=A0A948RRP4_UNCEI|nr:hypothetical protein [Candidatus Eisenbacteria bacterium]MBU1949158.1 hypothetical protein [Candidatus Eisenbacteria bacterium]MBU2689361.1 hypothetical protein [Candidatus Eisenbacteria bacterium]